MRPKRARERLWRELSHLFTEDGSSLPEIRLVDLSADGPARVFEELLRRAEPPDESQRVWHDEQKRELPLADVPDAGVLAAAGRISTLHVVLHGIRSGDVPIPDLGVSVWPSEIALDYRPGLEWNAYVLAAFVELLCELQALGEGDRLEVAGELDLLPNDVQLRFRGAVDNYLGANE